MWADSRARAAERERNPIEPLPDDVAPIDAIDPELRALVLGDDVSSLESEDPTLGDRLARGARGALFGTFAGVAPLVSRRFTPVHLRQPIDWAVVGALALAGAAVGACFGALGAQPDSPAATNESPRSAQPEPDTTATTTASSMPAIVLPPGSTPATVPAMPQSPSWRPT